MRPVSADASTVRRAGARAEAAAAANTGPAPDLPPPSAGEAARLQWAAEQLESLFINELWKSMRRTVNKTGMFDGPGVQLFEEMLDEERSKVMARAGGLGLAALLYEQLSQYLPEAPRGDAAAAAVHPADEQAGPEADEPGPTTDEPKLPPADEPAP